MRWKSLLVAAALLGPACQDATEASLDADTPADVLADVVGDAGKDPADADDGAGPSPEVAEADAAIDVTDAAAEADIAGDAPVEEAEVDDASAEPDAADPDATLADADLDVGADAAADGDVAEPDVAPTSLTAAACFAGQLPASGVPVVDYDQFQPVLGSHCKGTNHQDIQGVERVVFVGDSITVGTPPTPSAAWYRNVVAGALADRFDLEPPGFLWKEADVINGVALAKESGDFASCAKWGARTDDILQDPHKQLESCIPPSARDQTTLIVMTVGGNDVFKWAQDLADGGTLENVWTAADKALTHFEQAIHWATDDPAKFPNGVYVVFANTYELNDVDSASDLATCPGAGLIEMDVTLIDPGFNEAAAWFAEQMMRIAVETGTDLAFLGEHTCGHGYMLDDPEGRCYRGPGAENYLDVTCMHPSAAGHAAIADLFLSIVDE